MFRGCVTLITILAFLILIASVYFYLVLWPKEKVRQTTIVLHGLEKAEMAYRGEIETPLPADPSALAAALLGDNPREKAYLGEKQIPQRDGRFTDFWRQEIVIENRSSGEGLTFLSLGADGEQGTPDDLRPKDFWTHFPDQREPASANDTP
ncbi:MAG: hypothetical protein AAGA58_15985 [Verrucomicrobiota bacterium]